MNRQRGIAVELIIYAIAAAAVLAALGGIVYAIDSRGYQRGKLEITSAWEAADRAAEAAAQAEQRERARLAGEQSEKLSSAEGKARDADTRWRQARAEAAGAGKPLLVGECPQPAGAVAGGAPVDPVLRMATAIHFTAQFVREYDAAWTGQDGQPVFGNPGGTVTASEPTGAAGLLTVHAENASRCSDDRRRFNALIDLLETLRLP